MKHILKHFVTLLLVVSATTMALAGGGNRLGTGGAPELLIPVGGRDLAMGGASIATTSGIDALFWNPAGIARSPYGANLLFSHMSYIADIGVEYGAGSVSFEGLGTIGISVKSISVGDIAVTTEQNPDGTGQTYSPQFFVAGLTYARRLSDRISVGVTGNFVAERLAQVNANGVAFNVGIAYENLGSLNGLSLGVVVKNIGPSMTFSGPGLYQSATAADQLRGPQFYTRDAAPFELPSTIEIGLGYRAPMGGENSALQISTSFQNNNFSDDEYKVGAEYGYNNMFFVRGGWDFAPTASQNAYIYGPTVGAGVMINSEDINIGFDYTFRHTEYFAGNHVVSVKLGF